MKEIKMIDISTDAASKNSAELLRKIIKENITENLIVIDFSGITRFTTTFFNNSIGRLGCTYGEFIIDKVQCVNMSIVGKESYDSVINNTKILLDNIKRLPYRE